jgi:hypothetical protein
MQRICDGADKIQVKDRSSAESDDSKPEQVKRCVHLEYCLLPTPGIDTVILCTTVSGSI